MFRYLFLFAFLLASADVAPQKGLVINEKKATQLKKFAKEAERTGEIDLALEYYKQLIALDPANVKYWFNIAGLYRLSRNYAEAEHYYKQVCESGTEEYPEALYYFAVMQKANGKYKEALENLLKFKKTADKTNDGKIKKLLKPEIEGCNLAIAMKDTIPPALVYPIGSGINNPHTDFSPIPLSEKEFIFGSLREKEARFYDVKNMDTVHLPVRKFYVAEKKDEEWKFKGEWEGPFNSENENIGNGAFSPDRTKFYFTRCEQNWQYKTVCKIYCSEKKGKNWEEPYLMDDPINMPNFTSSHPTIGRESKKNQEVLYFVSDRPGTRGGMDIWYSEYDGRKKLFKAPKNAGGKINTVGTETTPFYDVKTKTLYYSTDGRPTIGGLDVYRAMGEKGKWEPPENLGIPINSSADDLDFALKPDFKGGFVVSNRAGGQSLYSATCCDDIYEFAFTNFIELMYEGKVKDKKANDCLDSVKLSVYIFNGEEKYLSEEIRISGCDYKIQLQPGINYLIEAGREGYFNNSFAVSTKNFKKSDTLRHDMELEKIPVQPIIIPRLNYDFNSSSLTPESKAVLDTTILILLKKNPNIVMELSSHTDDKGSSSYNMKLSQKRAENLVSYLTGKGINSNQLIAKGYGETKPIAPNQKADGSDNPEGRQLNRRTEIKIIGKIDFTSTYQEAPDNDEPGEKGRKNAVDEADEE